MSNEFKRVINHKNGTKSIIEYSYTDTTGRRGTILYLTILKKIIIDSEEYILSMKSDFISHHEYCYSTLRDYYRRDNGDPNEVILTVLDRDFTEKEIDDKTFYNWFDSDEIYTCWINSILDHEVSKYVLGDDDTPNIFNDMLDYENDVGASSYFNANIVKVSDILDLIKGV